VVKETRQAHGDLEMVNSDETQEIKGSKPGTARKKSRLIKEGGRAMKEGTGVNSMDTNMLFDKAFSGDKNAQDEIRNQFDNLNNFLDEAVPVLTRMAVNDHTVKIEGHYEGLADEAAVGVNQVRERLLHVADSIVKIGEGDISELEAYKKIGRRSENDRIVPAFIQCLGALKGLTIDSKTLANAAIEGRLDTRADASRHKGEYRIIVEGVNATLDAVIGPLNVAAEYVDRISKGEIPQKITEKYNGDFNEIKNNLNACIDGLQGMVEANAVLARMAVNDHSKGVEGTYQGVFAETKTSVNSVRDRVNHIADSLVKISNGDLTEADAYHKIGRRSDADRVVPAFIRTFDALQGLTGDASILTKAAVEGKLDTRADATKHQGDYRKIVEGVNATLDAVIGPLNVAAEYVDRISKGEIPAKITDKYNGDFNEIKNTLNACIDAVNGLVADANILAKAAVEGKLDTRADATKHQGDYRKIVEGVNATLDAVIGPLNVAAEYIDRISKGEIPAKITDKYNGDFNEIKNTLNACIDAINGLVADANMLAKAAVEGKLDTRADATKLQGDYRKIVEGVNATLDAVIGPLNVAAEYVDRISKGEIPQKITDKYNGDFNEIKNNLNACIDGLQGLVEANAVLSRMAVNDHSKGIEGNYQGVFAGVKTSVNLVRDRVNHVADSLVLISNGDLSEAEVYRKVVKRSDQDRLVPAFIRTFDALQGLTNDANILTKAAIEGRLKTRADAQKHHGEYKKIVEGINSTLDAVIEPVNEAMRMANEFAKCDFTARVNESLRVEGDFIKFKEALNSIGIEVSKAVNIVNQQVLDLASSAQEANASIEEVSSGAEQIAKNATGVSTNAEHGNEGITQVLRAMEDLNQTVTDVAQKAEKVSQLTEDANTLSVKGTGLAEQAERGMQSITTSSNEVDKIIVDIKAEMDKIGKIVGLISDLANQTNLLALNAAIEAARAGEAGRGFAVVATEVKSLAQESRASAENIADMIGTLQKKSMAAGEAVASSNREVKAGSEALSQTLRAFKDIAKSIEDISRNVVEVASVSEEQAATVEEVTASVNEVHGMVQATAKDAMDAAAASQEASASIDQITKVMGGVNAIVNNVSKEMAKFKV
jgi:methyl-accepting chemotaxis protein